VLTFSNGIRNHAIQYLPTPARKVHNVGIGLEYIKKLESLEKNTKTIATIVTHRKHEDNLKTFIYCVHAMVNDHHLLDRDLIFKVYSDQNLETLLDMQKINTLIKDLELEAHIKFETLANIYDAISNLDIFISLDFNEPFSDFEILAGLKEKPSILPRTAGRTNYTSEFPHIAQTYYFQDARELKTKVIDLLTHEKDYIVAMHSLHGKLVENFGLDSYIERLHGQYIRLHVQRVRYATKSLNH
jgi:glycosyltransferase involved in cell wall biosynthesis